MASPHTYRASRAPPAGTRRDVNELLRRKPNRKFVVIPNHINLTVQIVGGDGNRPETSKRSEPPKRTEASNRADCHPPLRRTVSNSVTR
jgi:hypothetical protein